MRAVLMQSGRLCVEDVVDPLPQRGEVLVKSLACGICGSDLHALKHTDDFIRTSRETGGAFKLTSNSPVVLGHEFCAEILEHGPGSSKVLKVGTRVCSVPALPGPNGTIPIGYSDRAPGGFAEYIRVPSTWVIRCPENLTTKQSMMIGTAGLTAGLCIAKIEQQLSLDSLKVIVSGATGGVSSIAIKILYNLGAKVTGITGKNNEEKFLKEIGCSEIIHRQEFIKSTRLPLNKGLYDAAVDVAGGNILSCIIASMKYNGIITACGNVAGPKLETTVFPFILRGNQLVGIDSATSSIKLREQVWNNFSSIWELNDLHRICKTISLNDLPFEIKKILQGKIT